MTTKEQERKALKQIREIIESMGANSYIATAFEGCCDDAEENIDNDFALSMNGRWQEAENRVKHLEEEVAHLKAGICSFEKQVDELEENIKDKDEIIKMRDKKIADLSANETQYYNMYCEGLFKHEELEKKVEEKDLEILKLKAKLYDFMTA